MKITIECDCGAKETQRAEKRNEPSFSGKTHDLEFDNFRIVSTYDHTQKLACEECGEQIDFRGRIMRTISKLHEQKVTKLVKMVDEKTYNVNNSGAPDFKAGDVRGQYILLECKTMKDPQKQQTIKKEFLEKLSEEAFFKKIDLNAVVLNFGDIEGEEYFLLDEKSFLDMHYAYINMKESE